jgi:protein-S-isoprenylcysteine O-methyltransferase Ste14
MKAFHRCLCITLGLVLLVIQTEAFTSPTPLCRPAAPPHPTKTALNVVAPVTAAITAIALPSAKTIIATTLLPTCIGFYKYEYGVSYAYGTATATTAYLVLRYLLTLSASTFTTMAQIHTAAIVFYGLRLNLFLLYREVFLEKFRKTRETIESRQTKKEGDVGLIGTIKKRTPFVLSCAVLYAGLSAPALTSGKLIQMGVMPSCDIGMMVYKVLVGLTWFGFGLGAIGDFTKTFVKSRRGPDHLVTGGVYGLFRHPNYTGEVIGWTSSFLASFAAVICTSGVKLQVLKSLALPLVLSFSGAFGIIFVLCGATTKLEIRQKEKYGNSEEYKDWVKSSWSGFKLPSPPPKKE